MKRLLRTLLLGVVCASAGWAAAERITFYTADNFGGREFTADRPVVNFADTGFNDRINSAVVHEGRWEICVDAEFRGGCGVLVPGSYPSLGAYAGRISSVRPLGRSYSEDRHDDRSRYREAHATLFEGPNLSGRSYSINDIVRNLAPTGFNDRASSLRVDSGYWIFCSDSDFRGECRTYGPGDYATLPGLNNVISSGRRISNEYPYSDRPNWQPPVRHSMNTSNRP